MGPSRFAFALLDFIDAWKAAVTLGACLALGILCIYEKQGEGGKRVDLVQIGHGFAYVFEGVCFGLGG